MPADGYILNEKSTDAFDRMAADLKRCVRWINSFRVSGAAIFTNGPDGACLVVGQAGDSARDPQAGEVSIVHITGNAAGGGKYFGRLLRAQVSAPRVSPTGNLTEEEVGIAGTSDDVLFLNLEEVGLESHVLTEGDSSPYAIGHCRGYSTEAPKKLVVVGLSLLSGCEPTEGDDTLDGGGA